MRGQQPGFWDIEERYARLSEVGDPLETLNGVVPWEVSASRWRRRCSARMERRAAGRLTIQC